MDFLDPRLRRRHSIRLMVGYGLMAIAISLTATILVYWAYGYSLNPKTGSVVENGLLFVDSKPSGAAIYLNGKDQHSSTSARMVLNAGIYDLVIKRDGYADWQRQFSLGEHSVTRIVYPLLLPKEPKPKSLKNYSSLPPMMTQSPDRRWLLIQPTNTAGAAGNLEVYDLSKNTPSAEPLNLPANLLSGGAGGNFTAVEWSADNNQVLLKHDFDGGTEFIVLNRVDPISSFNVNRLFSVNPTETSLANHKTDQIYLFNQADNSLMLGDVSKKTSQTILKKVLSYKLLANNLLVYVTDQNAPSGQALVKIFDAGKTYDLTTLAAGSKYYLAASLYQSHWFYAAGSSGSNRINIFKDPLDNLKKAVPSSPVVGLINPDIQSLILSTNSRFIATQSGQKLVVYDIENQTRYSYDISLPLSGLVKWLDGHHLISLTNGQLLIMDFDGQNARQFIPTANLPVIADRDANRLYNLTAISSGFSLQLTELRAGTDLPK